MSAKLITNNKYEKSYGYVLISIDHNQNDKLKALSKVVDKNHAMALWNYLMTQLCKSNSVIQVYSPSFTKEEWKKYTEYEKSELLHIHDINSVEDDTEYIRCNVTSNIIGCSIEYKILKVEMPDKEIVFVSNCSPL